jgi:hypothetical protein
VSDPLKLVFKCKKLAKLCKQKMKSMSKSEWGAVCEKVKNLEAEM